MMNEGQIEVVGIVWIDEKVVENVFQIVIGKVWFGIVDGQLVVGQVVDDFFCFVVVQGVIEQVV